MEAAIMNATAILLKKRFLGTRQAYLSKRRELDIILISMKNDDEYEFYMLV